ncbi:hypothetical protein CKO44_02920 [Rubrivivax gelatinosus]|uniref:glycosyltransferase n=1 Tax=Rubrivivax gelatinosus TaxID=28068 RepID=UPI001908B593|nr:glycosyltransferase [Rubrivivax gelatinosus]MBK1612417.1 hypothetical protein [Rubrivivax gelatinosus]
MAERGRVLFVTPCTISGYAGNIARFRQTIALLSRDHEVEFLSLVEPIGRNAGKLAGWGARPCRLPLVLQNSLRIAYKSIYLLNRLLVEGGFASAYRFGAFDMVGRALLALVPGWRRYDMVFTNYVWTARPWARAATTTVIDLHDIHANRHERLGAKVWVTLRPEDERQRIEESDVSLAIAWAEYQTLRARHGDIKVRFMPYWPTEAPQRDGHREPVAVFLASANQVNADALDNLRLSGVVEILVNLGARIRVCGAVCSTPQALSLQQAFPQAVELLGVVDDLGSTLNSAALGINLAGPSTGLKIKTVDYLHAGLKVIATAHGSDPWLERTCPLHLLILPDGPLNGPAQARAQEWLAAALAEQTAAPPEGPRKDAERCWAQALTARADADPRRTHA